MKLFCRNSIWLIVLVCLASTLVGQDPIPAPSGIPVESDWLYRQHYAQVQQILGLPLSEREARLTSYNSKLPSKAKVRQFMPNFFGQIAKDYQTAGQSAKSDALKKKIIKLFPSVVPKVTPEQELQMAYQQKNYAKATQLGEKLYASKPTTATASILAYSYMNTKNTAKAAAYSEKALSALGAKEGSFYALYLAEHYTGQQDIAKAVYYYDQLIRSFPNSAPPGWQGDRWAATLGQAHSLKATDAYMRQRYADAISSYYESLKYVPKNEQAYLFIGLSHWKEKEFDQAMGAFAIASVLNKPGSAKARDYLEQIFEARNPDSDSLDGVNAILEQARSAIQ